MEILESGGKEWLEGHLGKKAQSSVEVGGWEWTPGEC